MKQLLFALLLISHIGCAQKEVNRGYKVQVGEQVPELALLMVDGTVHTNESLKGKVVVLQFTASWCGVCRKEMPQLESEVWQRFKDEDFLLIGIDLKESPEKVEQLISSTGITYSMAIDDDGSLFQKFTLPGAGVTRNIVLDREGQIIFLTRLYERKEFETMIEIIEKELKKNLISKLTKNNKIIKWLSEGDVAIQYQTYRDLLHEEKPDLQARISTEGWGAKFLSKRNDDGHWGQKFYQPKWISTNYTLLDLKNLSIQPDHPAIKETVEMIGTEEKGIDGGINPAGSVRCSDVCINGMFMNYGCYFGVNANKLISVIDFLLSQCMEDGGFNCTLNRSGARHSSLHTTISVLEGILEYQKNGYSYRLEELKSVKQSSIEFILQHQLYISDRTGEIINKKFLRIPYPSRWYYDILRALDYFQEDDFNWDERMASAIQELLKKRRKDGRWNLQAKHPGQQHFEMEKAGTASRWNTLRAMRVLRHFGIEDTPL